MHARLRHFFTPPRFLLLTYIIGAALGFAQGLITARLLGAAGYGYIGILVTLGGLTSNFWDVRLIDLATKLHYAKTDDATAQTASARMLLLLNGSLGLLMALTTVLVAALGWHFFTETTPQTSWLLIQGAAIGLIFFTGTVQAMQRLTNSFYTFALGKLTTQIIGMIIILGWLFYQPDINGYYEGLLLTTLISPIIALILLAGLWRRQFGHSLLQGPLLSAWASYRGELHFVLSANFISYSKILTRSGDMLVFSLFASDSATGVYRLARSLADNLNVFVDAVNQYYNPRLMELLAKNDMASFTHTARRFFLCAGAVTLVAIPGAWIGLHFINLWFLHDDYDGLGLTTALLAANFIWIAGVTPWLWPAIVHHNAAHRMAVSALLGALVQIGLIVGLCLWVAPRPELAALAAMAYYWVCYPPLLLWWKAR